MGMPRRLLLALILLASLMPIACCGVTGIMVEPTDPLQGDTVTLRIQASPGEKVPITILFTKALAVSQGEYDLPLNGVSIPQTPNSFTVEAEGVLNLNVAVKVLFWITKSVDASGGVASVSQGGVPSGVYTARIYGQAALGVANVKLSVTASTTVAMGPDGLYAFSYDTGAISAGDLTARIGDVTRSITLRPAGGQDVVAPVGGVIEADRAATVGKEHRGETVGDEAKIRAIDPPAEPSPMPYVAGGILALVAVAIFVLLGRRFVGGTQSPTNPNP